MNEETEQKQEQKLEQKPEQKQEKPERVAPVKKYRKPAKKKVCAFCVAGEKSIDYKEVGKIRKYVTEKGKILPRRQTGVCAQHQRMLANAIKRARNMALLPYLGD